MTPSAASLRIGLALAGAEDARGWEEAIAAAEHAEALGLHSLWVPEGHFHRGATASPLLALAAFAARTQRIGLGTTSLLLSIHDPDRLAREVACLDHLSHGRLHLGLGRGFRKPLFEGFGVVAREKRDRFDQALDRMLEIWGSPDRAGPDAGSPAPQGRPRQLPHPPLYVAAFGAKGLRQASRRGLPYLASPIEPLAQLEQNVRLHREHLPEGLVPPGCVVLRTLHVAASRAEQERVNEALGREEREQASRLPEPLRTKLGPEASKRAIVGGPDEVARELQIYRERLDLDLLIVRGRTPGVPPEAQRRSLETLVGRVLPGLPGGGPAPSA